MKRSELRQLIREVIREPEKVTPFENWQNLYSGIKVMVTKIQGDKIFFKYNDLKSLKDEFKDEDAKAMFGQIDNLPLKDFIKYYEKSYIKEESQMTERQIGEAMAESGKSRVSDLLGYMKAHYAGKYDLKLAKEVAKEIVQSINEKIIKELETDKPTKKPDYKASIDNLIKNIQNLNADTYQAERDLQDNGILQSDKGIKFNKAKQYINKAVEYLKSIVEIKPT